MGKLVVPPNYFVSQSAELLRNKAHFQVFALKSAIGPSAPDSLKSIPNGFTNPVRVYKELLNFRPDLIHQHWATWSTPAVRAAKNLRVPLIVSVHGYDAFLPRVKARDIAVAGVKRFERRRALDSASTVIVNSEYMAGRVRSIGVAANKVQLIRHSVDTEFFTPGSSRRSGVLFVGRLSEEKGVSLLIDALSELDPETYDGLTVVGEGPLRQTLEEHAVRAGVPTRFTGQLGREAIRDEVRSARCVVVPSVPRGLQQEASGIVPLEAQACGTPVVVTRVGGLPESVAPLVKDLVTEPRAPELARGIRIALTRDLGQLSNDARSFALEHHSPEKLQEALWRLYCEHLSAKQI